MGRCISIVPKMSASTNTVRTVEGSGKPSTEPFAIERISVVCMYSIYVYTSQYNV